mmetsp:Transcript_76671/g.159525  ORF Transcript_76671/g.159525 Transcript_76671/m.159525 type:complete len:363 (-) Transcript_76671:38-1126(-)
MLRAGQLRYVAASIVLMTLQPLLVNLSKNEDGKLDYNPVSSTLTTEVFKLLLSITLYYANNNNNNRLPMSPDAMENMMYAIPAVIYFINNNLTFFTLQYIDATTWQLLSQLKTVFTALLFRYFLGRQLTVLQYLAIWQLACGTATGQIPKCTEEMAKGDYSDRKFSGFMFGSMLTVLSCLLSAVGGLYSEKLLKAKATESIHLQNAILYSWGVLFNIVGTVYHDPEVFEDGLFKGYNFWAVTVVINNALNGLAISAILKYADNIARVYAHACAMIVTMLLSTVLFNETPTPQLALAVLMVSASALQYNLKQEQLLALGTSASPKYTTSALSFSPSASPSKRTDGYGEDEELELGERPQNSPK